MVTNPGNRREGRAVQRHSMGHLPSQVRTDVGGGMTAPCLLLKRRSKTLGKVPPARNAGCNHSGSISNRLRALETKQESLSRQSDDEAAVDLGAVCYLVRSRSRSSFESARSGVAEGRGVKPFPRRWLPSRAICDIAPTLPSANSIWPFGSAPHPCPYLCRWLRPELPVSDSSKRWIFLLGISFLWFRPV